MATMITSDCINCGACEPECPNNAISQGDPVYVIDPLLCTECVGFHDYEACAAVCPVDVCVTDQNNIESEEVLIARARALHPETQFGESYQSRFRKGGGAAAVVAAPAAPGESAAPGAPAAPVESATPEAPAAPVSAPKPAAAPVVAKPPPRVVAPKPERVKQEPRPKKTFANELPGGFDAVQQEFASPTSAQPGLFRLAVIVLQPVIGALPHKIKKQLEEAVQSPLFTAGGSTAVNIVHNAVLYPLVCALFAVIWTHQPAVIFSKTINAYLGVGIVLACLEAVLRLKEGIFNAKPADEMRFPPALYGLALAPVAEIFLSKHLGMVRELPIPVEGFYGDGFVDKLERERRYGNVYTVEDCGGAFLVRMQFPRWIPEIGVASRAQLPDEMPDYDYDLVLKDGELVVKGKCVDDKVRMISSSVGAFPPEFTTTIPFRQRLAGFAHRFENKVLEVLLVKDQAAISVKR